MYMIMIKVTENFTEELRTMEVGEVKMFPLENEASIVSSIIPRLRRNMWKEKPDWKREGDYDMENGTFRIKRIA